MNKPISIPNDLTSQAPLGQLLLQSGKITQAQLEQALDLQNKSDERKLIGEALVELGYVDDATVLEAIAGAYDIPFATDTARLADPQVIEELPREFLEEHGVG